MKPGLQKREAAGVPHGQADEELHVGAEVRRGEAERARLLPDLEAGGIDSKTPREGVGRDH